MWKHSSEGVAGTTGERLNWRAIAIEAVIVAALVLTSSLLR
jgi:hypothetical protein